MISPGPCLLRAPALLSLLLLSFLASLAGCSSSGDVRYDPTPAPGRERLSGLLELELDHGAGRLWLLLPGSNQATGEPGVLARLLLVDGLSAGLGSNDIGLDRGSLGRTRVVALRRVGDRLILEQENHAHRADSTDPDERRAARESFATSILWAGPIERRADGREETELTSFVVRDAHGIGRALSASGGGELELDPERSLLDPAACHVFPDNIELEALLTFAGKSPSPEIARIAPGGDSLTLVQRQSLVRLPSPGFEPRRYDPRSGAIPLRYQDHAAALHGGVERAHALRHRLEKANRSAAVSEPVRPLVYYVDRGAPEPIRTALLEGARWWELAFREAGFVDALRVELLPADVHPLDARYNVIQWVHRATRGWSYGSSIVDPRTGEIIKGHVRLGSQRVRHDVLLFEGLAGTKNTGSGAPDDPLELALDRIRQLAAHEVGHTLGLAHNFAASTFGGRASVMDYPAPLVRVADGELDFSQAYGRGVGEWDVLAIRYLYEQPPIGVDLEARLHGLLVDADARAGGAHPLASPWDNGPNPLVELQALLQVRRVALERFGKDNVHPGQPLARLREVFAPLYLHHRYQVEACARFLGGVTYVHALGGGLWDGRSQLVNGEVQRRALDALLDTLDPSFLAVPEETQQLLLPRAPGSGPGSSAELLPSRSGEVFDFLAAAESAAGMVLDALLAPERLARVVQHHARQPGEQPGLEEVLSTMLRRSFNSPPREPSAEAELRRVVQRLEVERVMDLAGDDSISTAVRWRAEAALRNLAQLLAARTPADPVTVAFEAQLEAELRRFLDRPASARPLPTPAPEPPPGPPIGMGSFERVGCWALD